MCVAFQRGMCQSYDSDAIGYEEASSCYDEWDTGDNDYGSDSYDDSYDDDWQ